MKFRLLAITAILLLLALGTGLRFAYTRNTEHAAARPDRPAALRRVVYVDASRLVALHPGWDAMDEIYGTISAGDRAWNEASSISRSSVPADDMAVDGVQSVSRKALEKEAMRAAVKSLREWETQRCDALRARASSMREQLTDSSNASLNAKKAALEENAVEMIQASEENRAPQRLQARIKLAALRVAGKQTGVNSVSLEAKAINAQAMLDTIDKACDAERERINSSLKNQIDVMRASAEFDIDSQIGSYEKSEEARIRQSVLEAQDGVLQELSASGVDAENIDKPHGADRARASGSVANLKIPAVSIERGAKKNPAMVERMRLDVKRAVRLMAAKQGLDVVFVPKSGVPDATADFGKLLKNGRWPGMSLALSVIRG